MSPNTETPKKRRKGLTFIVCFLSTVIVGFLLGFAIYQLTNQETHLENTDPSFILAQQGYSGNSSQKMLSLIQDNAAITDTCEQAKHSVITIVAEAYYNGYLGESLGSGVIFQDDGEQLFIITNAHVVADAISLYLYSPEGDMTDLHLVGSDEESDIAVVSVLKSDLPEELSSSLTPCDMGDSDLLRSGDLAIAIGSPQDLAYQNSVTLGVISHPKREVTLSTTPSTYIQTDAAINPGNSGGGLFNEQGQLIGINSNKIVLQDVEGIGFAIPINRAMDVADSLMSTGFVQHLSLGGIDMYTFLPESMASLYHVPAGLIVQNVPSGCSASKEGILLGDIITEIDNIPLTSMEDVNEILYHHNEGDVVTLTVIRGRDTDSPLSFDITLESLNSANDNTGGFWGDTEPNTNSGTTFK